MIPLPDYMILSNASFLSERVLFAFAFLLFLAVIDVSTYWKLRPGIPSVITTLFILVELILSGLPGLFTGVVGLVFGLLVRDMGSVWGLADIKVLTGVSVAIGGVMFTSIFLLLTFVLKFLVEWLLHRFSPEFKVYPFIPVVLMGFLITVLAGFFVLPHGMVI